MDVVFTGLTPKQVEEFLSWFSEEGEVHCSDWFEIGARVPDFVMDLGKFEEGADQHIVYCKPKGG